MATRRMKRTKKQLHHGRRKTNRRHKRDKRTNKRHSGGMFALKGLAKFVGAKKINPKGGRLYDGIEVFSTSDNDFHIGNKRLDDYDVSSNPEDIIYVAKIRFYLKAAGIQHDNDMIVLNQVDYDNFVKAFASNTFVQTAASAAAVDSAGAAESDDSERNFELQLNTKGTPVLVFKDKQYEIKPGNPIIIKPEYQYGVLQNLVFLESTAPNKLTVTYTLKKTAEAYCAMSMFKGHVEDASSSLISDNFEFKFEIPCITQTIKTVLATKGQPFKFGDQVIPILDKINAYADITTSDRHGTTNLEYSLAYYRNANSDDSVDAATKLQILHILERHAPLSSKMATISLGATQ